MNNLLELGKSMVEDIVDTYRDSFFEYVNPKSLDDETYIKIGKELFENKEMFLDYMNYIYLDDFNWHQSEVESFDFIQEIVDVNIGESGKYIWNDRYETYVRLVDYEESLTQILKGKLFIPCCVESSKGDKRIYIDSYDATLNGYNVLAEDEETDVFVEDNDDTDGIFGYLCSVFSEDCPEIAGKLSIYFQIDTTKWTLDKNAKDMINKSTKQKRSAESIFYELINELLESNSDVLKKYGIKGADSNIYDVEIQ